MWVTRSVTVALLFLAAALPASAGSVHTTHAAHADPVRHAGHQNSIRAYEAKQRAYRTALWRYQRQQYLAALHAANVLKSRLKPRPVVIAARPPAVADTALLQAKQHAYRVSLWRYQRQQYLAALHAANVLKARLAAGPVVVTRPAPAAPATAPPVVLARVAPAVAPEPAPATRHAVIPRRPRLTARPRSASRAAPGYGWGQL